MRPFRTVIGHKYSKSDKIRIKVLAFRFPTTPVYSPAGSTEWFCFLFPARSEVWVNGCRKYCAQPSLQFVAPHSAIQHQGEGAFARSWFRFAWREGANELEKFGLEANQVYEVASLEKYEELLLQLHAELQEYPQTDPEIILALFEILCRQLQRQIIYPLQNKRELSEQHAQINKVRYFIESHFLEELSLAQLVKLSGLSRNVFCSLFAEQVHCTAMKYVQRLRIEMACDLLAHPHARVDNVASSCAFNDIYYFSRCFKKEMGISPIAYKKMVLR